MHVPSWLRGLGLTVFLLGLAACQTGNSQAPVTSPAPQPVVQYDTPTVGSPLGDGEHRVQNASFAPGCLTYASRGNTMFHLTGQGVSDLTNGAERLSLVLEQTPGGTACPSFHPRSGMPLAKLREPITYDSGTYIIRLLDRTCTGGAGNFYCELLGRQ